MYNNPRSHGLWEKTAPQPPATSSLMDTVHADVVIVGGGFTGQSAALHLAERGVNVVLLEAKQIGFGGAGRNVGLINGGMWVMPQELPGFWARSMVSAFSTCWAMRRSLSET